MIDVPLFHWSPTARRKQIIRYGLRPSMRSTVSSWTAPYVCFGESPSWAWALSGMRHPEVESWDLWQTWMSRLIAPSVLESFDEHRFHEVRTNERVYKRDLWYVATRAA